MLGACYGAVAGLSPKIDEPHFRWRPVPPDKQTLQNPRKPASIVLVCRNQSAAAPVPISLRSTETVERRNAVSRPLQAQEAAQRGSPARSRAADGLEATISRAAGIGSSAAKTRWRAGLAGLMTSWNQFNPSGRVRWGSQQRAAV